MPKILKLLAAAWEIFLGIMQLEQSDGKICLYLDNYIHHWLNTDKQSADMPLQVLQMPCQQGLLLFSADCPIVPDHNMQKFYCSILAKL
jgi:hypothetical protein